MGTTEDISENIKLLEKSRKRVDSVCDKLEAYDRRVQNHNAAIMELQDVVLIERKRFEELVKRVEKLERKYSGDVMYQ